MKSQRLVIDLVGGWLPTPRYEPYIKQTLPEFTLALLTMEPEYPGLEKISALVIWDRDEPLDLPKRPELENTIHQLVKRFAEVTNTTVFEIRHERRETKISFKGKDLVNVNNFEWINQNVESI